MIPYPDHIEPLPYYQQPPQEGIISRTRTRREEGKKIVIASGVFDLLHEAHRAYLTAAKGAGDFLVVLVESDQRVKEMKGEGRPRWLADRRIREIAKLEDVDEVLLLPPEFKTPERYEEILVLLSPHIYAVSRNSSHLQEKRSMMLKYGGELKVVLEEIPGISTTQLLQLEKR